MSNNQYNRLSLSDLFERSTIPEPNTGCYLWIGARAAGGYGIVTRYGKNHYVHRLFYEYKYGKIKQGLQLDHLCVNQSCCNPDHMEPVTPQENTLRSRAVTANHARQTHCVNGHDITGKDSKYKKRRMCKICAKLSKAKSRAKIRSDIKTGKRYSIRRKESPHDQ